MKREKKEISPYLLQSGYVMESCPMPWKCQGEKEKCEGRYEDGQRKKKGEEEKGRENEGNCPFEDMRVCLVTKVLRGNASHPVWGKRLHPLTAAQK
jgi:hypothetical protein